MLNFNCLYRLSYGFDFNLELICKSEFFKELKLALAHAISVFWKTHKCKLISNWTRQKNKHEKICAEKVPEDVSWSWFFRIQEHFFQSFCTKFLSLLYMISLAYKNSHCLSANRNPELWCVIYTGVSLFAPVLHLNCTALSQSKSSNFFLCIISFWNLTAWP